MRKDIPRIRTRLIQMIRDGQRRGEVRAGEAALPADMLSGALCAAAISAIRRKDLRCLVGALAVTRWVPDLQRSLNRWFFFALSRRRISRTPFCGSRASSRVGIYRLRFR
jgi:hypothetical protein